jgi:hypothetical protein
VSFLSFLAGLFGGYHYNKCKVCGAKWRIVDTAESYGVHPDDVNIMMDCSAKHGALAEFHKILQNCYRGNKSEG